MRDFFLRAKHWQLFLMIFALPVLFYFYAMQKMVMQILPLENGEFPAGDPFPLFSDFVYFIPIVLVSLFIWVGYMLTLMQSLSEKKPAELRTGLTFPMICLLLPTVYIVLIAVFMAVLVNNKEQFVDMAENSPNDFLLGIAMISPIHIFSILALIYVFYHSAKSLKIVELQKEPKKDEFIGDFFLFWISPIGIWLLQPRINKLFEQK